MAFTNADDGKKAPIKRNVTCHKCGVKGHYATDCPELAAERAAGFSATQTGTTLLMAGIAEGEFDDDSKTSFTFVNHGVTCQVGTDGRVPKSWILLDNQSTVDVFYNVYYLDVTDPAGNDTTDVTDGTLLINTVATNHANYMNRAYDRAVLARIIQKMIGRPSTAEYIQIVEKNLLTNCPVTREDIAAAEKNFGTEVGILKGKTVRRGAEHVEVAEVTIPSEIMSEYRDVIIGADVMYINKLPFFVTMSRNLKFSTAELMMDQKQATMVDHVKRIQSIYHKRGFRVSTFLMDGQFDVIRDDLADMNITLNTVARGEHVPEIERHIRTIRERVRCVYATLPFTKIPKRMLVELVFFFVLNSFLAHDGVSATLSPRSIVHGTNIDFAKHAKLEFGSYVQAHEEHDNTMATRTTGAIALRPTGNNQGGYYLYSLSTGKVLNRYHWTVLPMPNEVIDRVHVLARRAAADLTFADRDGAVIPNDDDDDDTDHDYVPDDDSDDDGGDDGDDDDGYDTDNDANVIDPDVDIAGVYEYDNPNDRDDPNNHNPDRDDPNNDNPNEPMILDETDEDDNPGNNKGGRDGTEPVDQIQPAIDANADGVDGTEPADNLHPVIADADTAEESMVDEENEPARNAARYRAIQSQGAEAARLLASAHNTRPHRNDAILNEKGDSRIWRRRCGRRVE